MLIRYQAYFNQKVATWLRDRISHSIEATSYGRFYEKNSQTYISWFTSDLEQIKGNAMNPTFEVIGRNYFCGHFCGSIIYVSLVQSFY